MPELLPENYVNSNISYGILADNAMFTSPGLVPFRKFEQINVDDFAYTVDYYLKKTQKSLFYFADLPETFDPRFINLMHNVGSKLLGQYNIPRENIRYACSAWPISDNLELYKRHCTENNWFQPQVILTNYFEYAMAVHIKERKPYFPTPSFNRKKIFTCFNGGPRPHRLFLLAYLYSNQLLEKCYYSLHTNHEAIKYTQYHINYYSPWYKDYRPLIDKLLDSNINFPLVLTISPGDFAGQHNISDHDIKLQFDSYFSVINETSFFKKDTLIEGDIFNGHLDSIFLTEKTFRTIACKQPFIMVSRPHTLKHMRRVGYKTFGEYIDESYDEIEDDVERFQKICEIIKDLCNKKRSFWKSFLDYTQPITEHNYEFLKSRQFYYISDGNI